MNMIDSINEVCYYLSLIFCFSFTNALDDEEVRNYTPQLFQILFVCSKQLYYVIFVKFTDRQYFEVGHAIN